MCYKKGFVTRDSHSRVDLHLAPLFCAKLRAARGVGESDAVLRRRERERPPASGGVPLRGMQARTACPRLRRVDGRRRSRSRCAGVGSRRRRTCFTTVSAAARYRKPRRARYTTVGQSGGKAPRHAKGKVARSRPWQGCGPTRVRARPRVERE